jgi:hypothetical protein
MRRACLFTLLSVGILASGHAASQPAIVNQGLGVSLASHRAIYDLSMSRADVTGGVADVRGQMALEFTDVCDGYTLTQRMQMNIITAEGEVLAGRHSITSWESYDGLKYRFQIRNASQGQPDEEFDGVAQLLGPGAKGTVKYNKPAGQQVALPAGVIFPTEHTVKLVRAAMAGQPHLAVVVFDGDANEGLSEVSGFLGRKIPPSQAKASQPALAKLRSWRGRLAYFKMKSNAERPDYELGFRLYENGIGDELVFDYGDFAVAARMVRVELPGSPGC